MRQIFLQKIEVLRQTATRLAAGADYDWSHQGKCNCGHLVQTVTRLPKDRIHAFALEKAGDWSEKVIDYCPESGYPIDHIIATMLELGFSRDDLIHLERLSAKTVLAEIAAERLPLRHSRRHDVVIYLHAWADLLEEEMLQQIELPQFKNTEIHREEFKGK